MEPSIYQFGAIPIWRKKRLEIGDLGDGCQLDAGCEVDSPMVLEWYHLKKLVLEKDTHVSLIMSPSFQYCLHQHSIYFPLGIWKVQYVWYFWTQNVTKIDVICITMFGHVAEVAKATKAAWEATWDIIPADMSNPFFNGDMLGILPILTNSMRIYWYIICIFGWKWGCAGIRINNMKM